ncbi:MAG: oligosaccharide flippase family protein, partial [Proteobacteria bacterium]|nr:oligosaccharide flippase family protein [Pseudomonadota bacterium]
MQQEMISPNKENKCELHKPELTCIAEGSSISFVGKVIGGGFQYLYVIIVARMLGADSFGLFVLGLTIINFAGVIGRLGLDSGVVRYVSLYNGIGDKKRVKGTIVQAFKYTFIVSTFLGIVLFLTSEPLF